MIGVISHDAGGAEIISSYVRQNDLSCIFSLDGPAISIFSRKLPDLISIQLVDAIRQAEWILCGTSWQSDLEWQAIKIAREMGKRSVVFLDHWVNYRERFVRNAEEQLPDEIWVGDSDALTIAQRLFPDVSVRFVENPYFNDLRNELTKYAPPFKEQSNSISILYVCEPIREHAFREFGDERYWGYTEEDALRYFLNNFNVIGFPVSCIVIRPHPSEACDKYDWVINEFTLPLERGGGRSLFEEVAASDMVVGCESMAMVIGLIAGKRVMSSIPPGGKVCGLPHSEIELLQFLRQAD